jgi:Amt family ammonium transporter
VTPAAGFISPRAALLLGAVAALPSYWGIVWRARTKLDDSLDVSAAHGLGGVVGALLTGVLASEAWGGFKGHLGVQLLGVLAAVVYSGGATLLLLKLVSLVLPLRARTRDEGMGLDVVAHGEEAYGTGEGAILVLHEPSGHALSSPAVAEHEA